MVKSTQQQVNLSKEEQLALKQARLVRQMANTEGWEQVVQPYLMERLNQSFPQFDVKNVEEFTYRAMVASVYKKVVAELLGWIAAQDQVIKDLTKKEKGEVRLGE